MDWEALNVILAHKVIKEIKPVGESSLEVVTEDGLQFQLYGNGYQDGCGYRHDSLDVTIFNEKGNTIFGGEMVSD